MRGITNFYYPKQIKPNSKKNKSKGKIIVSNYKIKLKLTNKEN